VSLSADLEVSVDQQASWP